MDLIVREIESESGDIARWAQSLMENPEASIFYYGLPEYPPLKITNKGDQIFIRAEIPGMDLKDFIISVSGRNLRISGEKKTAREGMKSCTHCMERPAGQFSRLIYLPQDMDPEKVKATYKNGILTVILVKKGESKPRTIEISPE